LRVHSRRHTSGDEPSRRKALRISPRLPGRTALVTGSTDGIGEELIDAALAVNIKSVIVLTGLIAPAIAARGTGVIVNLGSINGLAGMAGSALYSATKAAVHSPTKSWADEYGPAGVRVNTVAPGPWSSWPATTRPTSTAPRCPSTAAAAPFSTCTLFKSPVGFT